LEVAPLVGKSRDDEIAAEVKRALENAPGIKPYGLKADAVEGVVRLQGIVDVLVEKKQAEDIVRSVPGVLDVDNAITVSTDGNVDDKGVISEVLEELRSSKIPMDRIGAYVEDGVAVIKGTAKSQEEERLAIETVSKARGVKDVVSQLRIDAASIDDSL
jgi:hyperosmotically inducible protein